MEFKVSVSGQSSLFGLKNETVELVPIPSATRAHLTLAELEALRVQGPAVPASKHALETICGASGEIGAH
jgi:hypothetical protein